MPKQIPTVLLDHYQQDATTYCLLTRIKAQDGTLYGFTDLDSDIEYDPATVDPFGTGDDWGPLNHVADNGGFSAARFDSAADLSVDNTELAIVPDESGITARRLLAGLFDNAQVRIYRVNYMDLSMGHELVAAGLLDAARVSQNRGYHNFRSLSDLLKEPEYEAWTKTCPKQFGVATINGHLGCPKTFVWTNGTVTNIDIDEPARVFAGDDGGADDLYRFGVVHWLTGDNAGKEMDITQNTGGTYALALDTPYPIKIGDTYKVREDCSKVYDDADHGCLHHWGASDRNLYFGGCPDIPTADGGASMVPGARINSAT